MPVRAPGRVSAEDNGRPKAEGKSSFSTTFYRIFSAQQTDFSSSGLPLLISKDKPFSPKKEMNTHLEMSFLNWPTDYNQALFTPRAQSRFLDLGLLLRGFRPKSRSLPGRAEVIQPVVRACTTFWLTSTRITLTRVHRLSELPFFFLGITSPYTLETIQHVTTEEEPRWECGVDHLPRDSSLHRSLKAKAMQGSIHSLSNEKGAR